jgi:hypothetical protein
MTAFLSMRLLPLLFFALGPLMALVPRLVFIWVIVAAFAFLPFFVAQRTAIFHNISWRNVALMLAALLYTGLSSLWSPSPKGLEMALNLCGMVLCGTLLMLAHPFLPAMDKHRMGLGFALGWGLGFALLLCEFFLNFPIFRWVNGLSPTEFIGENVHKRAAALFAISLWPLAYLLEMRFKKGTAAVAVILFFFISGFLTSRSVLLGALVGMGVLFFSWHHASLARWALMAMIGFGVIFTPPLFAMLPLAPPEVTGRFFDSAQHRMKIWALTAEHVIDAPVFGNGIDASRGIESKVKAQAARYMPEGNAVISLHPHNIFLQIWLDGGIIGALIWGGLMLLLADRTRYLPEASQPYALAAIYCSLTLLSTTYSILQAWWMAGHLAVAVMLLTMAYSASRKAETSGTSAGGIA